MQQPKPSFIKIRDLPPHLAKYVHPVYRPLVTRQKRKFIHKRSLATRIKRKLLLHTILPRVSPYYCSKCTLNTRSLHLVRSHECSMKNESRHVISYENEVRIAHLGIKSKAKDCLAVMERIPNPQHVKLSIPMQNPHAPSTTQYYDPLPLRCMCMAVIAPMATKGDVIKNKEMDYSRDLKWFHLTYGMFQKEERGLYGWTYKCEWCNHFYQTYSEYDNHLVSTECYEKITEGLEPKVERVYHSGEIPSFRWYVENFDVEKKQRKKKKKRTISELECGECRQTGWKNDDEYLDHILSCGAAKAIKDREAKDREKYRPKFII